MKKDIILYFLGKIVVFPLVVMHARLRGKGQGQPGILSMLDRYSRAGSCIDMLDALAHKTVWRKAEQNVRLPRYAADA